MKANSSQWMMAQTPDGTGKAPVVITKEATSVTSGVAVTQKLVSAAIAFGNVLRGTFGPNGLDKMLYKTSGETSVTNDGAKIVAELLVKHPAAKAFVSLAESQENACGDGVTGCIILASELMSEAGRLLERGIHPLVVVKGYEMALEKTLEVIASRTVSASGKLEDVARTSLVGRSTEGALDHLAALIATSAIQLPDSDYEKVRMIKDGQGTISDSRIVNGIIIEKRMALDRIPRHLSNIEIAVLSCPVELEKTTREAEIEISTPDQLEAFIDAEDLALKSKAMKIIDSGVGAIFSAEKIDERVTHILADNGIYSLGNLEKSTAEDLAITSNASLCDHLDDITSSIGYIEKLDHERLEGNEGLTERLILDAGKNCGIVTILVGGTDGVAAAETIRGLFDSLRSTCIAKEDDSVVLGGGSLHMSASLSVRQEAEKCSGRERLSMEAFARALEAVPAALATNTGGDRIDSLLQLRSMHHSGKNSSGISHSGDPSEISGVWIPTYTLEHAISAACETATGLLRVDQVISARGD